jgi:multiple sugar transport system ATP-binding protein
MGAVNIRHVRKSYGSVDVLHDVSLAIADGEFVVLVGPSGCGKSTLLRMIAGLEHISSGEIEIAGKIVNDLPPKDRDIAMVFQSYALYPHMTVEQNMGFSLKLKGVAASEVRQRVAHAATILGLTQYLERYPRNLSGGQRQRVAMGRAIVRSPSAFLFDEPLSNLDAKLRVQMRSEIKQNHQRLKTTTIYVTHDQIEAMTMADRIVVMRDGVIEQVGTPLELYDTPSNRFVAGFIGSPSMNFIAGVIEGATFRTGDGATIALDARAAAPGPVPATLGIRPEHLHLDPTGFEVEVVTLEPTGAETHILARFAGGDFVGTFRERIDCRPGDRIRLSADARHVHLFDQAGKRLSAL